MSRTRTKPKGASAPSPKPANADFAAEFGRRLVAARLAAGYPSQAAAAEALGMNLIQYGDLERGRDPRWSTLRRVVDGLGLDVGCFFGDD